MRQQRYFYLYFNHITKLKICNRHRISFAYLTFKNVFYFKTLRPQSSWYTTDLLFSVRFCFFNWSSVNVLAYVLHCTADIDLNHPHNRNILPFSVCTSKILVFSNPLILTLPRITIFKPLPVLSSVHYCHCRECSIILAHRRCELGPTRSPFRGISFGALPAHNCCLPKLLRVDTPCIGDNCIKHWQCRSAKRKTVTRLKSPVAQKKQSLCAE